MSEALFCNAVLIAGRLSSEPRSRELPSGSLVVNLEVRVEHDDRGADSVPVACFEPSKSVRSLREGDEVVVSGTVRRRFFRAGGATVSRTEVVADTVAKGTQKSRVARLRASMAAQIADASAA